ncbi:hypothetical protein [Rhodopirellula sp. MGV]|uniref:hypothetical protein n=1 Tax=Rhodopirellula sp. MGV TaxID=2023130 RepID=UPI000B95F068|nr:hypothetical protein [Rhodopirellula sp. MGV]OYP28300.1 hypothetical protein CGZ80_26130 [Rhodopirellula sp. MGV]PNY38821.1 hypothetical protein C2E31_02665 [Rhodopirellula baltica]
MSKHRILGSLFAVLVIAGASVLCLVDAFADQSVQPIEQSEGMLMRSKLKRSQSVLEGLLRNDFAAIAQGANEMKLISEAAEWPRARDQVYEHFSAEFRRQCSELEDLAQKKNHQGATFTYLSMTKLCIECHNYVRDSLRVAEPNGRSGIQLIPAQWPESGR